MSRRPDGRDLVRRGHVGRVDEDGAADVHDRGADGHPLAVDGDRLGARQPQLLHDREDVAARGEVVAGVAVGRDDGAGVVQLDDDPGTGHRHQAGRDACPLQLAVEVLGDGRAALAGGLQVLDGCAEHQDLLLEGLLLLLEVQRRCHEGRALLAGDPDARTLGGELGRDEEAEREQGEKQRDLPAGDRPDAAPRSRPSDHTGPARRRTSARTITTRATTPRMDARTRPVAGAPACLPALAGCGGGLLGRGSDRSRGASGCRRRPRPGSSPREAVPSGAVWARTARVARPQAPSASLPRRPPRHGQGPW